MSVANDKTLRDLEFAHLKQIVAGYACCSLGKQAVESLSPKDNRQRVQKEFAQVSETISYFEQGGDISLGAVRDVTPLIERGKQKTLLLEGELLVILRTVESTANVAKSLLAIGKSPELNELGRRLRDYDSLAKRLVRAIDNDGTMKDSASTKLSSLKRKLQHAEETLNNKLQTFIDKNANLVSDPVITHRANRLVIPIRSGSIGVKDFVIHDRSSSGQTLYAEPASVVSDNNAISELGSAIRQERLRILRELTEACLAQESTFVNNCAILSQIDSVIARSRYAQSHNCSFPELANDIFLLNARHPLIPEDKVVPVTVSLGKDMRAMVITGPNTGGKTVTLKTIGLMTLMTLSGIPIPASADTRIPIVSKLYSDIGDEQSIEQNLSTFSSHMKNIVGILATADRDSLILLDELGAGTDPQEGAALGLSILEDLLERDTLVAVSTHLTAVKHFSIRHPAVKTASMEFDVDTLSPTFRVIEGVPGRSNAFVIARQLGISRQLTARAQKFLSKGEIKAEDIIEELQQERRAIQQDRDRTRERLAEAEKLKENYSKQLTAFEQNKESHLQSRLKALDTFVRESQKQVESLLAKLGDESDQSQTRSAYHTLTELRDELKLQRSDLDETDANGGQLPRDVLEEGTDVHVRSVGSNGKIVQVLGNDRVAVEIDGVRLVTGATDLEEARDTPSSTSRSSPGFSPLSTSGKVELQLNVRGATVKEALRRVDAYLDQLLLADIRHASILHGKGTGALRDSIRDYLSSCSYVSTYGSAPPRQGGEGVTIFELGRSSS